MKLSPVTFLVGTDSFQRQIFIEDLRKEVFPTGSGGLNDDHFDAKERKPMDVFDLANTLPMMASKRLIIYRNCAPKSEADQEAWIRYLENPSPETVLIATADKLDKRTKFFKVLNQKKMVQLLTEPKPRDLSSWVNKIATRHQVTLTAEARRALCEAIGTNLSAIHQAIEKLALFVHPETKISEKAVLALVSGSAGEDIFAWTDQVVSGELVRAVATLDHLLGQGEVPLILISMLTRHYRILLKAKHHEHMGTPRPQLPRHLGVPPFTVNKYMEQARRHTDRALREALANLVKVDQELKSTGLPTQILLETALRGLGHATAR